MTLRRWLTVYSFPIPLLLSVKHGVLVLGTHLFLPRHVLLPPLDRLHRNAFLRQSIINRRDYVIDHP